MKLTEQVEKEILEKDEIYPLTIVSDRYSGAYSGANFLAFNRDHYDMIEEIGGGDPIEEDFWLISKTCQNHKIGKGNTPDEAYIDLFKQLYPHK